MWNYAHINTRKLLCCGSYTKWNKWLMSAGTHHTFLLIANNNRHLRRNCFAVGHSWSAAKQSALRHPYVRHHSHCQGEPEQSVLIRVFFSPCYYVPSRCLLIYFSCNPCFCSNTVNVLSSEWQTTSCEKIIVLHAAAHTEIWRHIMKNSRSWCMDECTTVFT